MPMCKVRFFFKIYLGKCILILTFFLLVMLQAYREEPPLDVKCKDKFLILSTLVEGPLESMSLADLVKYTLFLFLESFIYSNVIFI